MPELGHGQALPSRHHPPVAVGKQGILLVNLGTPDAPDKQSVKHYLKEFLSDRRVVELHPLLWQPILRAVVLNVRSSKTAKAYQSIWRSDTQESPLRYYTRLQAEGLAKQFGLSQKHDVVVDWAMRYGRPSIKERIHALCDVGCRHITVLSLYPQYSASTTASVNDEVFCVLGAMRWQPSIHIIPPYYDHPAYIEALRHTIHQYLGSLSWQPDVVLASFHGLPQIYFKKGDPYYCHCQKTSRLLCKALGFDEQRWKTTFQSRFGPKAWLQPYTSDVLHQLAQKGKRKVVVLTPGFSVDCLETLEEIGMVEKEKFLQAGGTHFGVAPCLNDSASGVEMLKQLLTKPNCG